MSGRIVVPDEVGAAFTGDLMGPEDPEYEQVRRVHPGQHAALLAAAHRGAEEVGDGSIAHNVSNY